MSLSLSRFKKILQDCSKIRVAVVGDLMLDVYLTGSATRMSQEAPVPVLQVKNRSSRLGGAANVMRNLAALGAKTIAVGTVGADDPASVLRDLLDREKIDRKYVFTDKSRRTTEKMRVMANSQQIVRIDFEDVVPAASSLVAKMEKALTLLIREKKIDALIFEDYNKGLLDAGMVQRITLLAEKQGIYTSLDPHPGHPMEVKHLSIMTPNRNEAFGLAGMYCRDAVSPVENDDALKEVAAKILSSWKCRDLLITLGAQGMALFNGKQKNSVLAIPTKAKEVFDVSGAGDTVISVYTLCRAAGASDAEAAEIANHAAGIVVGKIGTAVTSPQEMISVFKRELHERIGS